MTFFRQWHSLSLYSLSLSYMPHSLPSTDSLCTYFITILSKMIKKLIFVNMYVLKLCPVISSRLYALYRFKSHCLQWHKTLSLNECNDDVINTSDLNLMYVKSTKICFCNLYKSNFCKPGSSQRTSHRNTLKLHCWAETSVFITEVAKSSYCTSQATDILYSFSCFWCNHQSHVPDATVNIDSFHIQYAVFVSLHHSHSEFAH